MIYLDYAASCPPFPEVISRISAVAAEAFGNPGALHQAGASGRQILQHSRISLARLLKVRPEEIFFTSGGTEANNWAVQLGCGHPAKKHILCSAAEHSSVLEPVRRLERNGYTITYLRPGRDGRICPEAVEDAIRSDTALLCIQAVNNETGVLQDVDALASLAKRYHIRYFCDGVQSFGHTAQNLHKAQLISLSAHKLGGPRGVGCLIVRQPLEAPPMLLGGGQEFGSRSGTENTPGIAGFALAAETAVRSLPAEQQRLNDLRMLLETGLREVCPEVQIAGEQAPRSSILSCRFPGIAAEEMVARLDLAGICASPGAACAAGSSEPSHVLLSMGYAPGEASEFVRFSPGRKTTRDEIHHTIRTIGEIYRKRSGRS